MSDTSLKPTENGENVVGVDRIGTLVHMVDDIVGISDDDHRVEKWGDLLTLLGYDVDDFL